MNKNDQTPEELVARFGRCSNYPRDKAGVQFLAQGLAKAADATGTDMKDIVDRCSELSEFCPTDYDLLTIASEIKAARRAQAEAKRDRTAEWARECGPPSPFKPNAEDISENGRIAQEKRKRMIILMREDCKSKGINIKKMSHQAAMRLQIWAQNQVGIEVTPEQRREVGE
jgi:hypothetical protein